MLTAKEISSEETEDPDIICAGTCDREFWLDKRAAKVGRKSVAWFRRIHRYKKPTIQDVLADRLEPVFESEFAYYKWNVGIVLCYLCNRMLTKKTVTRDHVVPQSKGGDNKQDNVMPCCVDCNHAKADMSLTEYLIQLDKGCSRVSEAV